MRLITVAIHTYDRALRLKQRFEAEGIPALLQNVNLEAPSVSPGVRVRIYENDLPLALRIIENPDTFLGDDKDVNDNGHYILVPVDFTELSFDAAKSGMLLAHMHKAKVLFFHTYIGPYLSSRMQLSDALTFELNENEARHQMEQTACTRMQHFVNRLNDKIEAGEIVRVPFETKVTEGVPEDAIVEFAKVNPPYCIVMGTRSSARKTAELIGSVTGEVLEKCRYSVLTVPESSDGNLDIKRVLYFCNQDAEDILALDTMVRIFSGKTTDDTEVSLVPVGGKRRPFDRSPRVTVDNLIDYCSKNFKRFTFKASPTEAFSADNIAELVKGYDLVVVPNRRKSAIARLLRPGLATEVLMRTDTPMLVIRV